jgi:dolichol-phosphate mannosyltransferase
MNLRPELAVVMPAYNEEESIGLVVEEWFSALETADVDFVFLVFNDGSRDGTARELTHLQARYGRRLEVITQPNCGHGQTCLAGYRTARWRDIPFVLQIDSDGQCDPVHFPGFWALRHDYDVIYGKRVRRDDGAWRALSSALVRALATVVGGARCADPNVPFRLMRTRVVAPYLDLVPAHFDLANIGLAVLLAREPDLRHGIVPIGFRPRLGGTPSVPMRRFALKACRLAIDLRVMLAATAIHEEWWLEGEAVSGARAR